MSVLSWLRGEQRAVDASDFNLGNELFPPKTSAGVSVTQESSLKLISVYACVTLIADAISSLPVDLLRRQGSERVEVDRKPMWLERPNPDQTWREFIDRLMHSLLVAGNAFALVTARDRLMFPSELYVIHPDEIQVRRQGNGPKEFLWGPEGRVFSHYSAARPDGEMVHVMGHSADGLVGLSPIDQARQAIGLGLAMEETGGRFFGNGSQVSGVIEMPTGSNPTEDQMKTLREQWARKYSGTKNAWKPVVLANGAQWKPITIPNDQAQFLESRKFSVAEIARLYRVPPHLVGDVERSTSWGTGIEQQGIGFVTYTLNPWIVRLEDQLSQLTPRGQFVRWNVNGLLRGDMASRFTAYQTAITNGWMSRNEVRELEDRPAVSGLDDFLIPVNTAQPQETNNAV